MRRIKKYTYFLIAISLFTLSLCTLVGAEQTKTYVDVSEDSLYKPYIDTVTAKGYMKGVSEDKFDPEGLTTRAALVTVLWRINGEPATEAVLPFVDLRSDWYIPAVRWSYANKLVNGRSATAFDPDGTLAKDALITIMYRYFLNEYTNYTQEGSIDAYEDASDVAVWAKDAFIWASSCGIIACETDASGKSYLCPESEVTRAELAFIISKYDEIYGFCGENTVTDDPSEDKNYLKIDCFKSSGSKKSHFTVKGNEKLFSFCHPIEWSIVKNQSGSFDISRGGKIIGRLSNKSAADTDEWKRVAYREIELDGVKNREYVEKRGSGSTLKFRYRYLYEYKIENTSHYLTLTLSYGEANRTVTKWLFADSVFKIANTASSSGIGKLEDLKDENIIVLGNSFLVISDIGKLLSELYINHSKSPIPVVLGRGYASVKSYVNDKNIMDDIKSGVYGGVFICGLYSEEEIDHLGVLKEACDESETRLILFPAYNEPVDIVKKALDTYPELEIVDWGEEIRLLIESGVNKWELCVNDKYLHSTTLGGYVGAHMIYRAIYGKTPTKDVSIVIFQKDIDKVLGDYAGTGIVKFEEATDVYCF